ncbi:CMGC/MAPK protein kinase [Saprolegnia diclina VS20]|uniref:Mitogen-activated protein kinase n=1 Tax=Saprolegnia diclina (strain VS20) TaxID=1156394 RepID=T0RII9_SAPDV|nr:CMGC/MAPK protein kinase [Saprolegnia diclina VS20]EQC29662.1 CMGC/MAPK protein kinase [Saprolegnia diclina VS20]|eukprot:XP_008616966.1 CMGC/MAPK protein kinase [Saprolegnia diclina VS20]
MVEPSRYGPSYHCVTVSRDVFEVRAQYVNLRPIGGGSYGIVCSAEDTLRGRKVAIKKITDVFDDLTDAKRILREMKLLRHLGTHENIINILDVILIPPDTTKFDDIYIVTDLMESDLERIISSTQALSDAHFQYFLYQILRGTKFIHSANVLHRDLKPSNLLVNSNCDLSICDFGLARGVELLHNEDLTEYVVTRWYRAPELLTDCQNYGNPVDMWAIGCIFAEMLRRRPFFTGKDPSDQLHMIVRVLGSPTLDEMRFVTHEAAKKAVTQHGYYPKRSLLEFFPDANPLAIDLLGRMLKFSPDERITVTQALEHPYLAQLHNPADEPVCHAPFNFDFERESLDQGVEMPKEELQRYVYLESTAIHHVENVDMGDDDDSSFLHADAIHLH